MPGDDGAAFEGNVTGMPGDDGATLDASHDVSIAPDGPAFDGPLQLRDAAPNPSADDPCPTQPLAVDCSGQCQAPPTTASCAWGCEALSQIIIKPSPRDLPYIFRAPTNFSSETSCYVSCPDGDLPVAYSAIVDISSLAGIPRLRARVGTPFSIADGRAQRCFTYATEAQCFDFAAHSNVGALVFVPLGTAKVPARNIYIESVSGTGPVCP
jgi:hypothetical protein